jgi:hypothetical protein
MSKRDAQLNATHYAGRASAMEDLVSLLKKKAGDAFGVGRDEDAHCYRELAKEVAKLAVAERDIQKREQEKS